MNTMYIKSMKKIILLCTLFFCVNCAGQLQPQLKEFFNNDFLIGAALNDNHFFERDKQGVDIVQRHFNTITPENVLKWIVVHPELNRYDFTASDKFVEFGVKNNMIIIGHTLVWHNQTPKWVFEDTAGNLISKEKLLERMRDHIYTVVGRYKGKIKGWDVVNEAVVDDGSYIQSMWMKIIGEEYLVKAFQYAHEADPDAELYYNDFSVENIPKRNGVIKLVKKLQAAGIKVSGIGMQGHYLMDWPTLGQIDSTIKEFAALGTKVMVTELDVDVLPRPDQSLSAEITNRFEYQEKLNPFKKGLPESKQQEFTQRYEELFKIFRKNSGKITRVTFWGVDDGSSWLNGFPVPGRTNYPLLFGRDGKPKPAFNAVVKIIQ